MRQITTFQQSRKMIDWHGKRCVIVAKYGMHYIPGNRLPYFSITADVWACTKTGERDRRYSDILAGGCMHEDIAKHFPNLADLIPWHLCDQDGEPMHYVDNAEYHHERHANGEVDKYNRPGASPKECFASTICFGTLDGDTPEELERLLSLPPKGPDIREELRVRLTILKGEFDEVMRRHDVQFIRNPEGWDSIG
jgi:hypothetical protein